MNPADLELYWLLLRRIEYLEQRLTYAQKAKRHARTARDRWKQRALAAEKDARKHNAWMNHLSTMNRKRREAIKLPTGGS
jgi:hypothetical protein